VIVVESDEFVFLSARQEFLPSHSTATLRGSMTRQSSSPFQTLATSRPCHERAPVVFGLLKHANSVSALDMHEVVVGGKEGGTDRKIEESADQRAHAVTFRVSTCTLGKIQKRG